MSDFDEEAERERLREKYERDEQKREVTERMSELLLKGATMTNAHCQDCGDPIFRYDGQEFCPTCQKAVERGEAADANGDGEDIEVASPGDARVQFGGDEPPEESDAEARGEAEGAPSSTRQESTPRAASGSAPDHGSLRTAHEALSRDIARLAQQAEACEDLGRKRDLLGATREAAEALAAVREAGR